MHVLGPFCRPKSFPYACAVSIFYMAYNMSVGLRGVLSPLYRNEVKVNRRIII